MDGQLSENFSLKPDQMQVVNPLLILIFIPLYDAVFYPLLSKIGVRRPLQKLTLGGVLAGVAFIISAILELQLQKTYPVIPGVGEAQLRIYNGLGCETNFRLNNQDFAIKSLEMYENFDLNPDNGNISYSFTAECYMNGNSQSGQFGVQSEMAISYFIKQDKILSFVDNTDKSSSGYPLVTILSSVANAANITFTDASGVIQHTRLSTNETLEAIELIPDTYTIRVGEQQIGDPIKLRLGGVHAYVVRDTVSIAICPPAIHCLIGIYSLGCKYVDHHRAQFD